jgi:GDPmannose 4,6-dehydratase
MKIALITGITGQDGAYLSELLLKKKYKVFGTSRNDKPDTTKLSALDIDKKVSIIRCDLNDASAVKKLIEKINPQEIYNFAGQSSVDYSFLYPAETMIDNIKPILNILEAVRNGNKKTKVFQASSSEMYGAETVMPIDERTPISPSNPYGVSKAASYMIVKNYRETYGLHCVCGINFNHESKVRSPKYFMRRMIRTVIDISRGKDEYVYLGQLDNKRDFGYTPDYTKAMWLMLQNKEPKDYVICSGTPLSIREVTKYVLKKFNVPENQIRIDKKLFRIPNVVEIYGDSSKIKKELGWEYNKTFFDILDILIEDELKVYK